MYIIEKLVKIYKSITKRAKTIEIPEIKDNMELEDVITCKHNFLPVDSSGEILACSKCGYLITKEKLIRTPFK